MHFNEPTPILPEGGKENSPGWSEAQPWECIHNMISSPVGALDISCHTPPSGARANAKAIRNRPIIVPRDVGVE